VHQGRTLQGVIRTFGLQVIVSETPPLLVNKGNQDDQGLLVAVSPVDQKLGELTGPILKGMGTPDAPLRRRPTA
jgi:hypothetical protein